MPNENGIPEVEQTKDHIEQFIETIYVTNFETIYPGLSLEQIKKDYREWCINSNRIPKIKYLQKVLQPYLRRHPGANCYSLSKKD